MSRPSLNTCSFLTQPPAIPACLKMHKPFHSLPARSVAGRQGASFRKVEGKSLRTKHDVASPPSSLNWPWWTAALDLGGIMHKRPSPRPRHAGAAAVCALFPGSSLLELPSHLPPAASICFDSVSALPSPTALRCFGALIIISSRFHTSCVEIEKAKWRNPKTWQRVHLEAQQHQIGSGGAAAR